MQFACQHQAFLQAIATVERAVSTREVKRILSGILLEAKQDQLRLVATDLGLGIQCFIPAEVSSEGVAVLEGRVLSQIARKLEGEQVLYSTGEASTAVLEGGLARFNLHTLPVEEFPAFPDVSEVSFWRMRQSELKRMIRETTFAAATDEARAALTGALLEIEEGEVRIISTDVSRLAFRSCKLVSPVEEAKSAIVPVRAMQEVARLLVTDDKSEVEFTFADNQVVFRLPGVTLVSRLIEGEFPDYRRAFPQEQPTRLRLERTAFLAAVERASLIARQGTPAIITLAATGDNLSISSREPDVGQVYEELPAKLEGVPGKATYQAYFLTEVLRALDADTVFMEIGEGLKQGSIRPVGDSQYLYVLMPVRVG